MQKKKGCIRNVGKMFPVETAVKRQKIIRGKDHGNRKSGHENIPVMVGEFKNEPQ